MTFRPANCPSCGGSLQVPDDHSTVKCLYCGGTVIVRDAIQAAAAASISNLLKLARTAANSLNHQEAYDYFSRVLELDGDNRAAWVGKGEAAGWLSHQTSRLPEMINCFHNAIDGPTDQTRVELKEQIAGATCKITGQIYTNMKAGLSPVFAEGETWRLYIEGLGNLIKTLESAHNLVPDSVMILRSVIFLCEDNSGTVSYINRKTGQRNWRALPTDWNTFINQRRDYFLEKLYTLDPSARPTETKSGLVGGFLPGISDALTRTQWALVGGGILLVVVVVIVGAIERASQGPQQNRSSRPSSVGKFSGTTEERAYLEASGRYLNVHFENCKSASLTMAGASDGSTSLNDVRRALQQSRSKINESWEKDFLPVSKNVPQRFADVDKKLRRVHALQEDAFLELLEYWKDERLSHITNGSSMFKQALLECDSAIKDLTKILDGFGSEPSNRVP